VSDPTPAPVKQTPWYSWLRRGVALVLLIGAGLALYNDKVPERCSDQISDGKLFENVCSTVSATDPISIWFLLVLVVLLLPDLSEIEVGGVLKLKRTVEEAQQEVEQTKAKAQELRADFTSLRQDAIAGAEAAAEAVAASVAKSMAQAGVIFNLGDSGEQIAKFWNAAVGGEEPSTPQLGTAEKRGAYTFLAFTAALRGLTQELFPALQQSITLVGFTLDQSGGFTATHTTENLPQPIVDAIEDDLTADPEFATRMPSFIGDDGWIAVTSLAYAGDGKLVGALAVVTSEDLTDAAQAGFQHDLAVGAAAAAGAYGSLLTQLLGEPVYTGTGEETP
jgi:hypothetical protein